MPEENRPAETSGQKMTRLIREAMQDEHPEVPEVRAALARWAAARKNGDAQ